MPTVVHYLVEKLSQLGVEDVFGVPGDYAFSINDAIVQRKDIRWIGCSNELNAAYAADGYARVRGLSVLNTTYGVGELSAINGIAGAYAEHVPIIHLVGMPARSVRNSDKLVHHMLKRGQGEPFCDAARHVVCAQALLDGQNCVAEIERVLTTMRKERRPIYIGIHADAAHEEVVFDKKVVSDLPTTFTEEARQVAQRIIGALQASKNPCVLPGILMARFGYKKEIQAFLERSGLPYATMLMDKTVASEHLPGYVGMYCGHIVQKRVAEFVEQADLVLALGTEETDFNTGVFTSRLQQSRMITVSPDGVSFGGDLAVRVPLGDVMLALAEYAEEITPKNIPGYLGDDLPTRRDDEIEDGIIRNHTLYAAVNNQLTSGDIVVGETGTISMGMGFVRLPNGVDFESQTLWGSIGWATPAAFGMAIAAPQRRIVLLTGEGAHQLTVQAIGEFARFNCRPLIIVLNNDGYLIERLLCDDGSRYYNDVAPWDYTALARGFGCRNWQCEKVKTPRALRQALGCLTADKGAYLEVFALFDDAAPMAEAMGKLVVKS